MLADAADAALTLRPVDRMRLQYPVAAGWAVSSVEPIELPGEFWRCAAWFCASEHAFLLDSARATPGRGEYSFLGGAPWAVFSARRIAGAPGEPQRAEIEVQRWDPLAREQAIERVIGWGDPFCELDRWLADVAMPRSLRAQIALPFIGGAVGYIGYEARHFIEALPARPRDPAAPPEFGLMFVDEVLAHDHATGQSYLAITGRGADAAQAGAAEALLRARWQTRLAAAIGCEARAPRSSDPAADGVGPRASSPAAEAGSSRSSGPAADGVRPRTPAPAADGGEIRRATVPTAVHAALDAARYAAVVQSAQEHILAGDVFQVCVTQRLAADYHRAGWSLYVCLRAVNPAPFACYLQFPWLRLLSSSPERFLRVNVRGQAESRPIKGTRPRGTNEAADAALRLELAHSSKDRAENIMIVDLVRNDFGRVCAVDSIDVPELLCVEDHPSVFQLVSCVRGRIEAPTRAVELLRACFPPGSMTGAPKLEAMRIIDALELDERGVYSGCAGYFDFGGGLDLCVVIRSFVLAEGGCSFGVGGGVVADSDPRAEYDESMTKAAALLAALERDAEGGSR
jgi:para-aminobenzoate synthetase component 1